MTMEAYYPEFFNDVFGPVMQPGSSSHTAGPCRLGNMANSLLKAPLRYIRIELDRQGSFAGTFGLMREDLGMLAGAYGLRPEDERMFDIREILRREGIGSEFVFCDFPAGSHPNAVRFFLTDENGHTVSLQGNSTGGGMVETETVCGVPCRFIGDCWLTVCRGACGIPSGAAAEERGGYTYITAEADLSGAIQGGEVCFTLPPVLPVCAPLHRKAQLFRDFDAWRAYAAAEGISLPEAAVCYEQNASGWSRERILARMRELLGFMQAQTEQVYRTEENLLEDPFSGYHFRQWRDYEAQQTPLAGGVVAKAVHYAFGVQALQRGVCLVPGPMGTGGGYLYAALRAVKETRGLSDEAALEGLLVAAGVGAICYSRTNPTGEMLGCTGECGVCGAMASAAVTQMCGGSPAQVEAAASLILQAAVGWPCDPIPGGMNQPCISRVLTAVVMSLTFADLALSGKSAVLPFHEVVDASDAMGRAMPSSLKCTSCGGMCATPAGLECRSEFDAWFASENGKQG